MLPKKTVLTVSAPIGDINDTIRFEKEMFSVKMVVLDHNSNEILFPDSYTIIQKKDAPRQPIDQHLCKKSIQQ